MPRHRVMNYLISICACLTMVLNGYDGSLFSSIQVLQTWNDYFGHPNANLLGVINTAYSCAGILSGFFVCPILMDNFGRRLPIFLSGVTVAIGAFVMTFTPNLGGFIAGRAIVGFGTSLGGPAAPTLINELGYTNIRGRLMSFWQMFWSFGAILASYIALGGSYSPGLGNWQWRLPVIFQVFTPLILCSTIYICPETPRYLLQNGKEEAARRALQRVRLPEEVEPELTEIKEAILYERTHTKGRYRQLFVNASYRKRIILAFILNFGQQMTGIGSLTNYSGIIYQQVFKSSSTIILLNAINWILAVLFVLTATYFSDKWGRKTLLFWGALGQAAMLLGVSTLVTQSHTNPDGTKSVGVGAGTALFFYLFNLFYQPSFGCTTWIWTCEIFPMVIRANGVAIGSQTQGIAQIILAQAFPPLLLAAGFYTFYFFMGVNLILAVFVWFFIPETRGVSLEHMDVLFGGIDHVVGGEKVLYREDGGEIINEPQDKHDNRTLVHNEKS